MDESRLPVPRLPMRARVWSSPTRVGSCPVCGGYWHPWVGSRLPCHAKCLFDEAGLRRLKEICEIPLLSYKEIAGAIGITEAVLRSILRR